MRVVNIVDYLMTEFPSIPAFNNSIDKDIKCIGVYLKERMGSIVALGGPQYSSYGMLNVTILVHWGEDAEECEEIAASIYNHLLEISEVLIGTNVVTNVELLDSHPVSVGRDDSNICEMTIRAQFNYKK